MLNVNNVNELKVLVNKLVETSEKSEYFTVQNNEDECLQLCLCDDSYCIEVLDLTTMLTVNEVYCETPETLTEAIVEAYELV